MNQSILNKSWTEMIQLPTLDDENGTQKCQLGQRGPV